MLLRMGFPLFRGISVDNFDLISATSALEQSWMKELIS
jgi:hypothetical protein